MRPLLALVLLAPLAAGAEPTPRVPPGPATTFLDGPLDADGWVDYEAAVNARLGAGVTPATNFVAAFAAAVGPTPDRGRLPAEFYQALGMPEPADGGPYLIDLHGFLKATTPDGAAASLDGVFEEEERVRDRPWAAKEFPRAARWLDAIDEPLNLAVVALGRPRFFLPLVAKRGPTGRGTILALGSPYSQKFRVMGVALSARAMARLGAGDDEGAWRDLLAACRLARHADRGGTLIDQLVAVSLSERACRGLGVYLAAAKPSPKRLREHLAALDAFAFAPTLPAAVPGVERLAILDGLTANSRELWAKGGASRRAAEKFVATPAWLATMKSVNGGWDQLDAATRLPDRAKRAAELTRLAKEFDKTTEAEVYAAIYQGLRLGGPAQADDERLAFPLAFAGMIRRALPTGVFKIIQSRERAWQHFEVTRVAFALGAYRADSGRYPATLGELVPKYLAALPADLFSGKPLAYKPSADGFLVYSVGVNGTDDGGRDYSDEPRADDIRVRLPPAK